jgi:homoserine O-acetyltransferase
MSLKTYRHKDPFRTERGETLPELEIAYHTYGTLNETKSNVIWVCHALTASSDVASWWSGLFGPGKTLDPKEYFIVCPNILGSCYGTSGPESLNTETQKLYGTSFPQITIRDMVRVHMLLRKELGIRKIRLCLGGSMGGYQVLEWAVQEPAIFDKLFLIATCAAESAWGIAIHTAQRLAIEADAGWNSDKAGAGEAGLKAARAIGMLTYRNYAAFVEAQSDPEPRLDGYRAESYIRHQGDKLVKRFSAKCYYLLTRAMDSHNIARGRGKVQDVLGSILTDTLIAGVKSDLLCPISEQKFLAAHMPNSMYREIDSPYGHDGFLIEWEQLSEMIGKFLNS